jgi:peptidoglycan-N-acetylglucosamine deacetylase
MRTPKVFVIGLALAGLVGCGTAIAAESSPSWTSTASPSTTSVEAKPISQSGDAAEPPASPEPPPAKPSAPATSKNPAKSSSESPSGSSSGSSSSKPKKPKPENTRRGPANSLTKTGEPGVALTFDDGPDPTNTPALLDLLAKHDVKATFCLVGQQVRAHPDLVRRMVAEGHTLCNHTWDHDLKLGKKSPDNIRADLKKTNAEILKAVPGAKIKWMRAPGGNFTPNFVKVVKELDMDALYWQVDTRDWDHSGGESDSRHTDMVIRSVKKHTGKGSIILSHDYNQPDTIRAYKTLIPWLKERYKLIPMPV